MGKYMKNILALSLTAFVALGLSSCKDDPDGTLAPAKVYMPQTEVLGGEIDNTYCIPSADAPGNPAYVIDYENNVLNILLGVAHDGISSEDEVSVDVSADTEYTDKAYVGIGKGMVLPADTYSLPQRVSVEAGEREKTFYLSVDLEKLKRNYPDYSVCNLVLAVRISNPSKYELSESRSMTLVVIDGASFIPKTDLVKISIPQASAFEGDVPNQYPIPLTGSPGAYQLDSEKGILKIFLNVQRDGIIPLQGFSVSVVSDTDHSNDVVSNLSRTAILPADTYTLPTEVTAENGELETDFSLDVDVAKLVQDYPDLSTSKLIVTVALKDPSKYELDSENSRVVIVINAPTFYPRDPNSNLIKGGDFGEESGQYWTFNAEQGHNYDGKVAIQDGKLIFSITGARCLVSVFQKITFEIPGTYNMMLTFSNPDGSKNSNSRTHITLTKLEPIPGVQFDYTLHPIYCMADVWGGEDSGLLYARTGQFMAEKTDLKGMDTNGYFTITEDDLGDWYVVIGGYSYNDGSLNITYDDLFIGEVLE